MGRPRTPIGTFGAVTVARSGTRWVASTRYRDWDGRLRKVEAAGDSRQAAERTLKKRLAARGEIEGSGGILTADTCFSELVTVWLEDLGLEGRIAVHTRSLRAGHADPRAAGVRATDAARDHRGGRVDRFLKQQARLSYSRAKHSKVVLGLALGLAVRYDAISRNPVPATARLRRPKTVPTALTIEQIRLIREAAAVWRAWEGPPRPKPDRQLGAIIEVMLGTSARIGEVLALRRGDVDVAGSPPTVRISGTIVTRKGQPVQRQDHPKTEASRRRVAIPSFAAEAPRQRLAVVGSGEEQLLFQTRNGTPLTPNNVRRQLRAVLEAAGIEGVTPHSFRRTVATTLNREAGVELAAATLGHSSHATIEEHYIEKPDLVDPRTAEVPEVLGPEGGA